MQIPVIDIFAGPGGLGEGFSALGQTQGAPYFRVALSVEKDSVAHQTLELRAFFRQFRHNLAPEEYYAFLRGELDRQELFRAYPDEAQAAKDHAWHAELGTPEVDATIDGRISKAVAGHEKWVLIGGPPCQAYSLIGRARNSKQREKADKDVRNILYIEYLNIVARYRPAVFVMENVKGMLSSRVDGHRIFDRIIADLERPSEGTRYRIFSLVKKGLAQCGSQYSPEDFIVECEQYGVPQARHRVILLGIREDLAEKRIPGILRKAETVTVSDVLRGLPPVRSGLSRNMDDPDLWAEMVRQGTDRRWLKGARRIGGNAVAERLESVLSSVEVPDFDRGGEFLPCSSNVSENLAWWYHDSRLNGVCNHMARTHIIKDIYRYAYASCFGEIWGRSPLLREYPPDLLPEHKNAKTGHFEDRFRVQIFDKPSTTVTSHMSKDGHYYIHPDPAQLRSLTVREAARLQTFPDNYFFCGNRTQQYVQVGNAVPPLLAYQIAEIVRDLLEKV
uniref:DNA (cytosine-5-)-methyltransferase n=1 Tax=Geobacter metallireducens TaxID=28232 RepID=A0A831TYT4_GEOME